jgi:hypothetical protein
MGGDEVWGGAMGPKHTTCGFFCFFSELRWNNEVKKQKEVI